MADFIMFNEGKAELENNGLPSTCRFDLSTKTVDELGAATTFAGGFAKATGTGYGEKTQAEPTSAAGVASFAKMTWETGSATDWPAGVKSVVLRTNEKVICAWNLQAGGGGRDMSKAKTNQSYTPTLSLS
ncbi:MAG TPA: hypothetical protein VFN92_08240 [Solirubrobacterales bacterium]|nr:hypothetical protein [Solirubrobacterales bacterium]